MCGSFWLFVDKKPSINRFALALPEVCNADLRSVGLLTSGSACAFLQHAACILLQAPGLGIEVDDPAAGVALRCHWPRASLSKPKPQSPQPSLINPLNKTLLNSAKQQAANLGLLRAHTTFANGSLEVMHLNSLSCTVPTQAQL